MQDRITAHQAKINSDMQRFLRRRMRSEEAAAAITRRLRQRERSFLRLMQHAVYANPRSPYRILLDRAGVTLADMSHGVKRNGLEGTLARLYDAGVYVTPAEFKGRRPIRRGTLELPVESRDFDNPLVTGHFEVHTGGSRGPATPVSIDLRLLAHEAAYTHAFLEGFGLRGRPVACWRGVPPIASGVKMLLQYAKLGLKVERWFAQNRPAEGDTSVASAFTRNLLDAAVRAGFPLPEPEYVHQDDAVTIAHWLAQHRAAGVPAQLDTNASSAVRVCLAAADHNLDITGTFFRVGGEPYTPAKVAIIERAGCRAATHYSNTEMGHAGIACASPAQVDDVHLMTEKVAVLRRPVPNPAEATSADDGLLVLTTLMPSAPKIMLNVDTGDCGELRQRHCGCPLGKLGLDLHVCNLHSYDSITSEGLSYLRGDLLPLIEEILPVRFGGSASDYQIVEIEERGMPFVEIVVSPRIAGVDAEAVRSTVYEWLRGRPGGPLMAEFWQDADTVKVVRRAPYATGAAKVLPLHRRTERDSGR